jgi:hypothetical protein
MDRPYRTLGRNKLTRLALMSQDARAVALAIVEMEMRGRLSAQTMDFANAHLMALQARDQALTDLQFFRQIFPRLEQRVRDLEGVRSAVSAVSRTQ